MPSRVYHQIKRNPLEAPRSVVGSGLLVLFLWVMVMALVPQWHDWFHHESSESEHEYQCAVSWLVQGGCDAPQVMTEVSLCLIPELEIPFVEVVCGKITSVVVGLLEHAPPCA